ncbi:MAG TPA: glycosyltransferase family 39 protein [Solirubrobacteraceae bacterium]|nr:glycosyltransferase family 39 protein [Solirubrobacteraceae bacterium]
MTARGREIVLFALLAVAAVVLWALIRTYPNYDAYYDLDWGRELLHGHAPSFDAYKAPTEHPLYLALGTLLAAVFGEHADRALVLVAALSMVALIWAVFRTGRAVFGFWQGVVAALLTASSFALLLYVARAYVDVPFLAAVLWAAALEAERPRRGLPVMVLLAVAGLLRPEAWLLAGAYWAWCVWPRDAQGRRHPHLGLLALVIAPPLVWALVDLAVTGDPLHSLHATSDLADELHRVRGIAHVPGSFVSFVVDALRVPVALAALAGLALVALRVPRPPARSLHVPLALLGAGTLAFVITGAAGLSILPRYLTVPVIALTLFAGEAIAGWTTLPRGGRQRRRWGAGVVALAVVGVVFVVAKAGVVHRFTAELRFITGVHDDLVATLRDPQVARARRCGPVTFPNYRLVPDARWILDASRTQVGARSARRRPHGVAIFMTDAKTLSRYGFADGASPRTNVPDPGYVPLVRHGRFAAYVSCP